MVSGRLSISMAGIVYVQGLGRIRQHGRQAGKRAVDGYHDGPRAPSYLQYTR